MRRAAALALLLAATAARADRMPDHPAEVRAAIADVCVIGTVIEIEKEPTLAKAYPGATDPTAYTVAVVKVETNIQGANHVTHVRVGFLPPERLQRYPQPTLKADQKVCLFLSKVPDAAIFLMPALSPPVEVNDQNKELVASVKSLAPVFADPMAALAAEKAEDRLLAAVALVTKYRQPRFGVATVPEEVPAAETKAILAALAGGDWTKPGRMSAVTAVNLLALSKADGFQQPQPKPGEDVLPLTRDEFKRWAANEGTKYKLTKLVPKAK